jgi:tetratricopeptide (TPR) repeat protein
VDNPQTLRRGDQDSREREAFQPRLLRFLKHCEGQYGSERVWVLATARNEPVPDSEGQLSPWQMLQLEQYPQLKKEFKVHELKLSAIENVAYEGLLRDLARQTGLSIQEADIPTIAASNDGGFANLIENLRRCSNQSLVLDQATFVETPTGLWRNRYQAAVGKYPIARELYRAALSLRQMHLDLQAWLVKAVGQLLLGRRQNVLLRLYRNWQMQKALDYLVARENLLTPRDGQLEACAGPSLDLEPYLPEIQRLLIRRARRNRDAIGLLFDFSVYLGFQSGHLSLAIACLDELLRIQPNFAAAYTNRGLAKANSRDTPGAIADYDKAIELQPDYATAYYNRGLAKANSGDTPGAIADYDKAIELQPDFAPAYFSRACSYALSAQIDLALQDLAQAISLDAAYRDLAGQDSDFDALRDSLQFQVLIAQPADQNS